MIVQGAGADVGVATVEVGSVAGNAAGDVVAVDIQEHEHMEYRKELVGVGGSIIGSGNREDELCREGSRCRG